MEDIAQLLSHHKLSLTRNRINIISVLFNSEVPISEKEIQLKLKKVCDKSTIYRNLNTLTEKGVLQRILSGGSLKYKLLSQGNKENKKQDHVHFQCIKCNKLICMEDLLVKDYTLPEGFSKVENQFLILGSCKECNDG
jgi:Fur family transcriptional regulator, ferric uptake regulator